MKGYCFSDYYACVVQSKLLVSKKESENLVSVHNIAQNCREPHGDMSPDNAWRFSLASAFIHELVLVQYTRLVLLPLVYQDMALLQT